MAGDAHSWRRVQERDRAWERINSAMGEIDPEGEAAVALSHALVLLNRLVTTEEHMVLWEALGDALTEIADGRRRDASRHAGWRGSVHRHTHHDAEE